jgi:hypothetical protein
MTFAGYDPGGNGKHGLALLDTVRGKAISLETTTLATPEAVLQRLQDVDNLVGIGIDTLTCWSTGSSGWRPADRWLRMQYPEVRPSIVSPNGMYGSMGLNGMSVLCVLRSISPGLVITETHPKVLHWALRRSKYDYGEGHNEMDGALTVELGINVQTTNDHEWDAASSLLPLLRGYDEDWTQDLHQLPTAPTERIVQPCGETHYFWPYTEGV